MGLKLLIPNCEDSEEITDTDLIRPYQTTGGGILVMSDAQDQFYVRIKNRKPCIFSNFFYTI